MIRRRGIAIIITAILLFVLAGITRVGWLLLFDAVLWGLVIVSAITPWIAIGKISLTRRIVGWDGEPGSDGPMDGDVVFIESTVTNHGLLPAMFVTIQNDWAEGEPEASKKNLFIAWLGRNSTLSARTNVKYSRRGLHYIPAAIVETTLPFGMFRRRKRAGNVVEALVLPRVFPMKRLDMLAHAGNQNPRPNPARSGEEISGSRAYAPGDPWQHIHWRNTARTNQPQIKEFEKSPENSLTIAFDTYAVTNDDKALVEHTIRIAASVGAFVCSSGGDVNILTAGLALETSESPRLLRQLAPLAYSEEPSLHSLLERVAYTSDILVIVADSDARAIAKLSSLANANRRITAVVLVGFGKGNPRAAVVDSLNGEGIRAVECRRNDIPSAIEQLQGLAASSGVRAFAEQRNGQTPETTRV